MASSDNNCSDHSGKTGTAENLPKKKKKERRRVTDARVGINDDLLLVVGLWHIESNKAATSSSSSCS